MNKLRELAEAATPGPWVAEDTSDQYDDPDNNRSPQTGWFRKGPGQVDVSDDYNTLSWADAAYIAALNPTVALLLADVVDAAEGTVRDGVPPDALMNPDIPGGKELRDWWLRFGVPLVALRAALAKLQEVMP